MNCLERLELIYHGLKQCEGRYYIKLQNFWRLSCTKREEWVTRYLRKFNLATEQSDVVKIQSFGNNKICSFDDDVVSLNCFRMWAG